MQRRRFIELTGGVSILAGCSTVTPEDDEPGDSKASEDPDDLDAATEPPQESESLAEEPESHGVIDGTIADATGTPLAEASVEAIEVGPTVVASTTTDARGRFALSAGTAPLWLRVAHPDYVSRVRAVEPGEYTVRLTPAEDTISLAFGGDVMFGRQFYQDGEGLSPRIGIDSDDPLEDHRAILRPLTPLLQDGDVTSINLESPLTTSAWRHPEKTHAFTSHPAAAQALAEAGVDYAALGNNHVFDALEPGLADTITALEEAGVQFSGAGMSSEDAWEPAYVERGAVRIAIISCTYLAGVTFDIDWSADRNGSRTHTVSQEGSEGEDERLEFSGDVGVAEVTEDRLAERITEARNEADIVVVQIHGGIEYQRTPSEGMIRLVDAASDAGADAVINHHPHVAGGLEFRDGTLVAWTLGNLIFDQGLWETFRSYLLTVHITGTEIRRAYIEPVLIDSYVPKGVTGNVRDKIAWQTAELSADEFALVDGELEFTSGADPRQRRETETLTGDDDIYVRDSSWVETAESGTDSMRVGFDRLFTGSFENCVVDGERPGGPLWQFDRDRHDIAPGIGYGGTSGITLHRSREDIEDAVLGPSHRVPVNGGPLTLTGLYRTGGNGDLGIQVYWYENRQTREYFRTETVDAAGTEGRWERARVSFRPPNTASYIDFRLKLSPPRVRERRQASVDDWRLIDWTVDETTRGRAADHLGVVGTGTVRFAVDERSDRTANVTWDTIDG